MGDDRGGWVLIANDYKVEDGGFGDVGGSSLMSQADLINNRISTGLVQTK